MAKTMSFGQLNGRYGCSVNRKLNWENLKLKELKWQSANLKNWNEKLWNLNGEFCILA